MDEQTKGFRSAVFGGFRREDVLRYIEETDAKYYEESERLRSSLDDAQTAMGELRGQNVKLTEKNAVFAPDDRDRGAERARGDACGGERQYDERKRQARGEMRRV